MVRPLLPGVGARVDRHTNGDPTVALRVSPHSSQEVRAGWRLSSTIVVRQLAQPVSM